MVVTIIKQPNLTGHIYFLHMKYNPTFTLELHDAPTENSFCSAHTKVNYEKTIFGLRSVYSSPNKS